MKEGTDDSGVSLVTIALSVTLVAAIGVIVYGVTTFFGGPFDGMTQQEKRECVIRVVRSSPRPDRADHEERERARKTMLRRFENECEVTRQEAIDIMVEQAAEHMKNLAEMM